jgi:hypothetical protein
MGLMLFLISALQAKTIHAEYDVSYGIFGTIGTAKAKLEKSRKKYTIDIHLAATGMAKKLSGNRTERHVSKGHIAHGVLISDEYKVIRSYRNTRVVKTYSIDHKRKRVLKYYKKYKDGKLVSEEKTRLAFYSKDDLLTLYFNLDRVLPDKHHPGIYHFKAVGAEKQKGKVTVVIPSKKDLPGFKHDLEDGAAWYATVIIHQKIFMSKEGRLQLAVGKDGITQTALLKDLILFGDIKAVRKK